MPTMLCTICRRSLLARIPIPQSSLPSRYTSTTTSSSSSSQSLPPPHPPQGLKLPTANSKSNLTDSTAPAPAPAHSSSSTPSTSQPFSTPTASHIQSTLPQQPPMHAKDHPGSNTRTLLTGSIPGGGPLHGLAYLKNKPQILAKEDSEYPSWLWRLLDHTPDSNNTHGKGGNETKVNLSALTKKQRAKHDRKQERLAKSLPKKIPVHEQSVDLTGPGDDAMTSLHRRQEIVRSSRVARRKGIRENNFLRGM